MILSEIVSIAVEKNSTPSNIKGVTAREGHLVDRLLQGPSHLSGVCQPRPHDGDRYPTFFKLMDFTEILRAESEYKYLL